jgi:hypothetical protein
LYTYTLFRRLGYEIRVHPAIPEATGHPDFLVSQSGSTMYIECVVLFEDGSTPTSDSEAWIKDCVDAARNPDFMVSIRIERRGTRRPKRRDITRQIETWLETLDYDLVHDALLQKVELPWRSFEFGDARVKLTAIPVKPEARGHDGGRIGIGPSSGAFQIQSVNEIRAILKDKAKQCRGVDAPLVVAILNWTTFATPREVEDALFGSAAIQRDSQSANMIRMANGYWHPGPPLRGTSISAVMFGEHLHTSRVTAELPTLWLNPWASRPLTERLPFVTHTAHDTGEVFLAAATSASPDAVFGLAPDWPGFD